MTLGGTVIVRNGLSLDYCFELAIQSLLPICDQVVVADSDSTDGTGDALREMAAGDVRIKVVNWPWPSPHNSGGEWLTDWINFARSHLETDMHFALDADEVLDNKSHPEVLRAAAAGHSLWCRRLNFWKDAKHLIPEGMVCGSRVVRLGPSSLWMPSDAPYPKGEPEIRRVARRSSVDVFHYGFIRKDEAFKAKCRVMTNAYFGTTDPRIIEAEDKKVHWTEITHFDGTPLQDWSGTHPEIALPWLRERGHEV